MGYQLPAPLGHGWRCQLFSEMPWPSQGQVVDNCRRPPAPFLCRSRTSRSFFAAEDASLVLTEGGKQAFLLLKCCCLALRPGHCHAFDGPLKRSCSGCFFFWQVAWQTPFLSWFEGIARGYTALLRLGTLSIGCCGRVSSMHFTRLCIAACKCWVT